MKKITTVIIFLLVLKIASAQSSLGNSIIFDYIDDNYIGDNQKKIARPIVIYKYGQYLAPPFIWSDDELSGLTTTEKNQHIQLNNEFKKELSDCNSLFLLNNGVKYKSIKVTKVSKYQGNLSSWLALEIESAPEHQLLSNNPKLGTNILQPLGKNDRPVIKKIRKENDGNQYEIDFSLISKVDIDGDGIPELIYYFQAYESGWVEIYSKKNGKWKKVYEGAGDGA